MVRDLTKETFD